MTENLPEPHLLSDQYSWQTPDMLLSEHGLEGLINIRSQLSAKLTVAETVAVEAKNALQLAIENAKDIRANIDVVIAAEKLGRDQDLE